MNDAQFGSQVASLLDEGLARVDEDVLTRLQVARKAALSLAVAPRHARALAVAAIMIGGFFLFRAVFDPNVMAAEAVNPQFAGNIGGLGLPSLVAWPVGGAPAAN